MNKWLKRGFWTLGSLLLLTLLLYTFRTSILRGIGGYLIVEDPSARAEVAFVLGGNSYDRGEKAAAVHKAERVDRLVCLGANVPEILHVFGLDSSESEITARIVKEAGVPAADVQVYERGTSTMEEALSCFRYCQKKGVDSAIVISDKFHLRRVRYVFEPIFEGSGIELSYQGVSSTNYDESRWWRSEEGMIMVNNEYMKLLYYRFFRKDPAEIRKGSMTGEK